MLCARRLSKYVKPAQSKVLHRLYLWGIWIKGVDGLVEIIVGVLLLAISQAALNRFVSGLIRHQWHVMIFERLTTHLRQSMYYVSNGTKLFGSAYLLGHGTIKAGLVWGGADEG